MEQKPAPDLAYDDASYVPLVLQRQGTIYDKSDSLLRWARQLMLHAVEGRPNVTVIPIE